MRTASIASTGVIVHYPGLDNGTFYRLCQPFDKSAAQCRANSASPSDSTEALRWISVLDAVSKPDDIEEGWVVVAEAFDYGATTRSSASVVT
jgi:hypothetical protein